MDIKILVATHKKYWMPKDEIYLPIHVGKKGKDDLGYIGDDTGDNISIKNPNYCELTGLYWAWKNMDCEHKVYVIIDVILRINQKVINWKIKDKLF